MPFEFSSGKLVLFLFLFLQIEHEGKFFLLGEGEGYWKGVGDLQILDRYN